MESTQQWAPEAWWPDQCARGVSGPSKEQTSVRQAQLVCLLNSPSKVIRGE